jgi:hypothetical protein
MIDPKRIWAVKRIVVHTDADGTASAMILKNVVPEASVEYVQYDTKAHVNMKAEPGMIFCDFSPHFSRVEEFLEAEALVLDHHETTREVVGRFAEKGLGVFGDMKKEPGVCGATLAYEHIWNRATTESVRAREQEIHVKDLALLAGIRDTWQTQDPRWIEACEQASAMNFWGREKLVGTNPEEWPGMLKPIGKQAYANHLRSVRRALKGAYRFTTPGGLRAVVFQGYIEVSDAADMVDGEADVICGFSTFFEDGEPYVLFGLRSRNDDFNVGLMAEASAPGGGGHAKSAGFRRQINLTDPNPFCMFRDILIKYEASHCTCGEDNNDGGPSLPHKSWCSKAEA